MPVYSERSDAYAYGIYIYELLTFKLPYVGRYDRDQITYLVGKGILRPDTSLLDNVRYPVLAEIALQCIAYRSNERPTFEKVQFGYLMPQGN